MITTGKGTNQIWPKQETHFRGNTLLLVHLWAGGNKICRQGILRHCRQGIVLRKKTHIWNPRMEVGFCQIFIFFKQLSDFQVEIAVRDLEGRNYKKPLGGGNSNCFIFTPKPGEIRSNLTSIFFKWGWFNHQLDQYFWILPQGPLTPHPAVGPGTPRSACRSATPPKADTTLMPPQRVPWTLGG